MYPGAPSLVLENFRRALSPDPDCPWVFEDDEVLAMEEKELSGPYLALDDNQCAIYFFSILFSLLALQTLHLNILTLVFLILSIRERRFFLVIHTIK